MDKRVIPVCFCANDKYLPYTAVTIQSIAENSNADNFYKLYILYSDISEKYQEMLKEQVSAYKNFSLDFVDVNDYVEKHNLNEVYTTEAFSKEVYYRLLIPYMFSNYDKVIYLDSDIICLTDIAKMADGDSGCMIKAVRDYEFLINGSEFRRRAEELGLKDDHNYFNSGVIVFNTNIFIQEISEEKLFDYVRRNMYSAPDQDILNIVCEGKVDFLEMNWNVFEVDMSKKMIKEFRSAYNIARKNPYIIHYSRVKPWKNFIMTQRTKYFWMTVRETKFADIIYLGLKNISVEEMSYHNVIYTDILNGQKYGLRFIIDCAALWLTMKLDALKTPRPER
ncbi:MAG: glycosyltransferase family 8 protein [Spirochaetaceae bacterium]|jgi:lipopolysaccharide biosynthesis glycosyltransferase|nr:glycosyltransferase family 8 protein [Spirochaetaceae bacterium]